MFCPRHPKLHLTATGRVARDGMPTMHCAVCVKAQREKVLALIAMHRRNGFTRKQIVLPPVAAWER